MKKLFFAWIMLLALLISFQQVILFMNYQFHQEAIEKAFCENKEKPNLHCHGLCHLKKQLDKTSENSGTKNQENKRVDMLPIIKLELEPLWTILVDTEVRSNYKESNYTSPFLEIFIPPPSMV